jgi:hypothetical protein
MHGTVTLGAQVTNVSTDSFWLLLGDEEIAVPFSEFPWFKKATVEQLSEVQRPTEDHLAGPRRRFAIHFRQPGQGVLPP